MSANGEMGDADISKPEGLDASRKQGEFAYDVSVFHPQNGHEMVKCVDSI